MAEEATTREASLALVHTDDVVTVQLAGPWQLHRGIGARAAALKHDLSQAGKPARLVFDTHRLGAWDTGLVTFLTELEEFCTT